MGRRALGRARPGPYIVAQVLGGIAAGFVLLQIASGSATFAIGAPAPGAFARNGFDAPSPGGHSPAAFLCEVVLTALFLVVILGATCARAPAGFARHGR